MLPVRNLSEETKLVHVRAAPSEDGDSPGVDVGPKPNNLVQAGSPETEIVMESHLRLSNQSESDESETEDLEETDEQHGEQRHGSKSPDTPTGHDHKTEPNDCLSAVDLGKCIFETSEAFVDKVDRDSFIPPRHLQLRLGDTARTTHISVYEEAVSADGGKEYMLLDRISSDEIG